MVLVEFVNDVIFNLHIIECKCNAQKFANMLEETIALFLQPEWTFMRDDTSTYRGKHAKKWLEKINIQVLACPSYIQDLNPFGKV